MYTSSSGSSIEYRDVTIETALDAIGNERNFSCVEDGSNGNSTKIMWCRRSRVHTHNNRKATPQDSFSPSEYIRNPPSPWDAVGVSAHANTIEVAKFLEDVCEHYGLDGYGKEYSSFVHYSGRYANNAFWHPTYEIFVYGQCDEGNNGNGETAYFAAGKSLVAHEIFHGVTFFVTSDPNNGASLGCKGESGALNESYSDIFGVLIANLHRSSISDWNWEIGIPGGFKSEGFPMRDLSNPKRFKQPDHNDDYVITENDQGGVHINNGIHNKAAYNLLTSTDSAGNYLFDVTSAGFLFYSALRRLSYGSKFSDSRVALNTVACSCFQEDSMLESVQEAIAHAFDSVGILESPLQ